MILANMPVTNARSAEILVESGVDNIGGVGGPSLPIGLREVQQLWQTWSGTSNQYTPIKKYEFLVRA